MIRLAVRAPPDAAEQVLATLLEIVPCGVEQVDGDGFVEYAIYGAPRELTELAVGDAEVGGIAVRVSGTEVADDWAERWKQFHRPVLVAGRIYVRPPWEAVSPVEGAIDLSIDPGRAFGTGAHPTTRLCLELLLEVANRGGVARSSVCDLGCGSGVLAIAAAKLGFGPVEALDADRLAVYATLANAAENGVELERVDRIDLRNRPAPAADVVTANLMRPLLLRVAGLLDTPPCTLIASGLLAHEADEVAAAFGPTLAEAARHTDSGWSALLLARR